MYLLTHPEKTKTLKYQKYKKCQILNKNTKTLKYQNLKYTKYKLSKDKVGKTFEFDCCKHVTLKLTLVFKDQNISLFYCKPSSHTPFR